MAFNSSCTIITFQTAHFYPFIDSVTFLHTHNIRVRRHCDTIASHLAISNNYELHCIILPQVTCLTVSIAYKINQLQAPRSIINRDGKQRLYIDYHTRYSKTFLCCRSSLVIFSVDYYT